MLKHLLAVAVFLVCACAQEHRCEAPLHFEAHANMHDHETHFFRAGYFAYDAVVEKVRFLEAVQENATRPQVDEIFDYREKKVYSIDLKTRKCTHKELTRPFHRIAVPEGSRFFGREIIGSLDAIGEGVEISVWGYHVNDSVAEGNSTISFTTRECIPFTDTFYGMSKSTKQEMHYHRTFFDVTIGLSDPNIFDVPKECMM